MARPTRVRGPRVERWRRGKTSTADRGIRPPDAAWTASAGHVPASATVSSLYHAYLNRIKRVPELMRWEISQHADLVDTWVPIHVMNDHASSTACAVPKYPLPRVSECFLG